MVQLDNTYAWHITCSININSLPFSKGAYLLGLFLLNKSKNKNLTDLFSKIN